MRSDKEQKEGFSRRAIVLGAAQGGIIALLAGRYFQLQVIDGQIYHTQAEGNRIRIQPIMPVRGDILDRDGAMLAEGKERYDILYEPYAEISVDEHEAALRKIAKLIDVKDDTIITRWIQAVKDNMADLLTLKENISWDLMAQMESQAVTLPGLRVHVPYIRHYPIAEEAAHITGYVGRVSESDIAARPEMRHILITPEARVGKNGLELAAEETLFGRAGIRQLEADARGNFVRELNMEPPKAGQDITTTIDAGLQSFIMKTLKGHGGLKKEGASAVVLDVTNGDILAIASVPSYDPNKFVGGIDPAYWNSLINDKDKPLHNRAISAKYPPGSTFKMVTALAAMRAGIAQERTTHYCPGFFEFGDRVFHCWEKRGHGHMDMVSALAQSCNVYFYNLAAELGIETIAGMARELGLGEPLGIELPGEISGIVPDDAWKRETLGKPWYPGETINVAIGQGFVSATPLQLATMSARIATGQAVQPRITQDASLRAMERVMIDDGQMIYLPKQQESFEKLNIPPWHLEVVRRGMDAVVNRWNGTAQRHKITDPALRFAGKTGTSQVRASQDKGAAKRRQDKTHALFVGYAPVENPRYAISVVVEHGGGGSSAAGPLAGKIFRHLLGIDEPTEETENNLPEGAAAIVDDTAPIINQTEDNPDQAISLPWQHGE